MALAGLVQGAGESFLAGAGFAVEEDGDVLVQNLAQPTHVLLQLHVLACQLFEAGMASPCRHRRCSPQRAVAGGDAQADVQQKRLSMATQLGTAGAATGEVEQLVDIGVQQLLDRRPQQLAAVRKEGRPIGTDHPATFIQRKQLLGRQVRELVTRFQRQGQAVAVALAEMAVLDQPGV
ncbi:hypothetical protein D3C81_1100260 [compost metagenome]